MTVSVGEQLIDNYQVTELPDDGSTTATSSLQQNLVETALLARIEFLEAQLEKLQSNEKKSKKSQPFSIDQIKHNDHLVSFYTGFPSFAMFWSFTSFLDHLLTNFITGDQTRCQKAESFYKAYSNGSTIYDTG